MDAKRLLRRYDPLEKSQLLDALLEEITPNDDEVELVSYKDIFTEAKEIADKGDQFSGLSTGFPNTLDRMTLGLSPGDLIVFFGYTSMGKSQLAQNVSLNVARNGTPVLFIGLELTNRQNAARIIKMGGNDDKLPFLFPAKQDINYLDIQPAIAKAMEQDCGLVIVDQLQDLIHDKANEQGEITQIMAELKRAALANDVPIIVMSHVNRLGATKGPPTLDVLKGSSSIEQKADIAIAVYQDKEADPGDLTYNKMVVALRKNRQKGMSFRGAMLDIGEGMRLIEPSSNQALDKLQQVFPGAQEV